LTIQAKNWTIRANKGIILAYSRVIPSYDLYGEQTTPGWSSSFNFEWIPQRSEIYNWTIQPHRHDSFLQFLYLSNGYVDVHLNDIKTRAYAPCVLLIPAGHVHGFVFSKNVDGPVVTATQKALESVASSVMPELVETIRTPRILSLQPEMRYISQLMPLCLAIEQEAQTHAIGQMAAGMSLLLALLVQVNRITKLSGISNGQTHQTISRKARQIEKFRSLVDRDFKKQLALKSYANEIGVTVGHLSRLCRDVLGRSSLEIINARIIQEAERELVYTTISIQQLAYELGFEDDAYFTRFFKKHTGVSPKTFRLNYLQKISLESNSR
jgi:AraC family transcriptional activator of pobA